MGRKRAGRSTDDTSAGIAGEYQISSGTARVVADEFYPGGYLLEVNGVPSSHIVLGEPLHLEFEYMRWIAAAVEEFAPTPHEDLRVTHLGGAGCSLPRYFAERWPGSRHTVVELDAELADLARMLFDVPRAPTVKIRVGEARAATDGFRPGSRDVIIRDVFAGAITPRPLTTVEFFRSAHAALVPGGLLAANCGDHSDLSLAKAELTGMTEVFSHVAAIADPPMLKGRRYGNIILLASDSPLDDAPSLTKQLLAGAVPAQFKGEAWARRLASGIQPFYDLS